MEKEKKKVLIVIDVQNDFVTGVLGTPEAQAIVPNVKKKFDEYKNNKNYVILTKDTHHSDYADTSEGRKLPEHCMCCCNQRYVWYCYESHLWNCQWRANYDL